VGAASIGAIDDEAIQEAMGLPVEEQPLCLIPVGRP